MIPEEKIEQYKWFNKGSKEAKKNCEHILSEYVYETRRKVTADEYCWEALQKYKRVIAEDKEKRFTLNNNAEVLPDIANDFVAYYLPREYPEFSKELAIELVKHLCEWLKIKKYTHSYISSL